MQTTYPLWSSQQGSQEDPPVQPASHVVQATPSSSGPGRASWLVQVMIFLRKRPLSSSSCSRGGGKEHWVGGGDRVAGRRAGVVAVPSRV
ncbi:hypothetical protein GDO81_012591 [Engystomops pustulosus]|uniref:Uncharacterized protein n=1 Tax=Engystomops pustulosus TaxID=76066 RepID=A0AAV7AUC3_ENGPU|nr:hypothetical protein GDO81_012591 [Engystomops pustulosus]